MSAGYSGTPLIRKLGIRAMHTIMFINAPDHYPELLGELPENVELVKVTHDQPVDLIHFFARDSNTLFSMLSKLKKKIKKDGILWVSWIKRIILHEDGYQRK